MVTAPQHGTWMDEEGFKKTCIKERKKRGGLHQPFYGTWVADFMLRRDAGRFMLGKYLSNKKNPMAEKETIGDGGGRKYANSQFSDQNRKDSISRVLELLKQEPGSLRNCLSRSLAGPSTKHS